MGISESATSRLGQAHIRLVDGLPLFTVAVVLDGDAPQRVSGHDRVGNGGQLRG
jgi:hypothetical protein